MVELILAGSTIVMGWLYWSTRAELKRLTDRDELGRYTKR